VAVIAAISTGCGEDSMNTRYPARSSASIAVENRTGSRRLAYQYAASASGPSRWSPVIADTIGSRAGCGVIPASAVSTSSRMASTCGPWEA
jgi:hypothetical protein